MFSRVLLLVMLPLFLFAQTRDSSFIPFGSYFISDPLKIAETYYQAAPFPVDTIQLDSLDLMQYFLSRSEPKGRDKVYQESIDFLIASDIAVWVTDDYYGYNGLRQKNVRVFVRQDQTGLFRMKEIKHLGSTRYITRGMDPFGGKKHTFRTESNCPLECTKRLMPTNVDVTILDARHIEVNRYRVVRNGPRRAGIQYSKLKTIPEILEIGSISKLILSMDWLGFPTEFYCECDE